MGERVEWDARAYATLGTPQRAWGRAVLARRAWRGDEVVLDGGCGPGTLTQDLFALIPNGRVVAVDADPDMVRQAQERLRPYGPRATVVERDLLDLSGVGPVDVVFSNAVFHWILDAPRLYRSVLGALRPGGELLAQCGGRGNVSRVEAASGPLRDDPRFRSYFSAWHDPWRFDDEATTARLLGEAGFTRIEASLEQAPTRFDTLAEFLAFGRAAPLRPYLQYLPDEKVRGRWLDSFAQEWERRGWDWTYDYVRLNIRAGRA